MKMTYSLDGVLLVASLKHFLEVLALALQAPGEAMKIR
jgi:hypothetical protein